MIRMKEMVFARAEVAFLGCSPDVITGNLSLRRKLFCWICQQRNSQLRQAQGASALSGACALSRMCSLQGFRAACSDVNFTGNREAALEAPCRSPCWHLGEHH